MSSANPELLRSLGRLVRGLSALFWGLPLALIVCVGMAGAGWFEAYGIFPPLAAAGLLLFGLFQLGAFQKQERPWRLALERAQLLGLMNFGLSPFLYWWCKLPQQPFFATMFWLLIFTALLFLFTLNVVLFRLGAILPDEGLRMEMKHYTVLNRNLLLVLITILGTYALITRVLVRLFPQLPHLSDHAELLALQISIPALGLELSSAWLVWMMTCFLVLLPLSMTMALIWKTKEVILENVFGGH